MKSHTKVAVLLIFGFVLNWLSRVCYHQLTDAEDEERHQSYNFLLRFLLTLNPGVASLFTGLATWLHLINLTYYNQMDVVSDVISSPYSRLKLFGSFSLLQWTPICLASMTTICVYLTCLTFG